jgi:predicted membrane-bound spermidine synthase
MTSTVAFPKMTTLLQPAERGVSKIEHITVTKEMASLGNMRASFTPGGWLFLVTPGEYARLSVRGQLVMTDTQMEQRSNEAFVRQANGRVLVAGLGLGMILHPVLAKANVEHVTVLEKEQSVIDLVGPSLAHYGERLTIVAADAFDWKPAKGERWDTIYFDIWPHICSDNLDDYARLVRRYSPRLTRKTNVRAWLGGWLVEYLRDMRRDGRSR